MVASKTFPTVFVYIRGASGGATSSLWLISMVRFQWLVQHLITMGKFVKNGAVWNLTVVAMVGML